MTKPTGYFKLISHNTKAQMHWGGNDDTRGCLQIGRIYRATIDTHKWHTKLLIGGKQFNAVCFEQIKKKQNKDNITHLQDFPVTINPLNNNFN